MIAVKLGASLREFVISALNGILSETTASGGQSCGAEQMPSRTPLRVFGSISRFRRMMRGSGMSHAELLVMQDDLEWRLVTEAATRNVLLMGAVDARRLASARRVRRLAQQARRQVGRAAGLRSCRV
jgi:hypothetical protein